jgi:hypothetical protein
MPEVSTVNTLCRTAARSSCWSRFWRRGSRQRAWRRPWPRSTTCARSAGALSGQQSPLVLRWSKHLVCISPRAGIHTLHAESGSAMKSGFVSICCRARRCRTRQEAAAVSGVVPHLVRLAAPPVRPPVLMFSPHPDHLSCRGLAAWTLLHISFQRCTAAHCHGYVTVRPLEPQCSTITRGSVDKQRS